MRLYCYYCKIGSGDRNREVIIYHIPHSYSGQHLDSLFSLRISQGPHTGARHTCRGFIVKTPTMQHWSYLSFSKTRQLKESSILAFDVIAGPGGAVDVLLVQAHANQTWVLIWHPALHVLYKQVKPCSFFMQWLVLY